MADDDTDDLLDFASLHTSPASTRPAKPAAELDPEEKKALDFVRSAPFRAEALKLI